MVTDAPSALGAAGPSGEPSAQQPCLEAPGVAEVPVAPGLPGAAAAASELAR